jgi:YHS domain-containing protein
MMILRRMRRRTAASAPSIAAVILCASMIPSLVRATEPTPISWREDYGGALEEAKATNRLVWIQFTGPWCPNCMRMERDSFPDADVIDHAQRSFVPLKLRSDVHEQLALGFNLSGLPATVLVAPTREIVAVRQGYLGPDELEQLLSQGLAAWRDREATAKAASETKNGAASRPKDEVRLALSGYCPVSLIANRRLVHGQGEHTVQHEGHVYRFASADLSTQFRKDPERFIPVNRGNCPVTQVDDGAAKPGDPRWGVLYQGRLFVFTSDEARRRFLGDPQRYAMVDVAEQGFCPHCLGETGLLVRGDPKYSITREGRRYWFPDSTHLSAFLAANPSAMASSTSTATDTANGPASTTRR